MLRDVADHDRRFRFDQLTNTRDVFAGGDCQETVARFLRLLRWEQDFLGILPPDLAAEAGSHGRSRSQVLSRRRSKRFQKALVFHEGRWKMS